MRLKLLFLFAVLATCVAMSYGAAARAGQAADATATAADATKDATAAAGAAAAGDKAKAGEAGKEAAKNAAAGKEKEDEVEEHEEPDDDDERVYRRSRRRRRRRDDDDDDYERRGRRYHRWRHTDDEEDDPTGRDHYDDHGGHDTDYDHDAVLGSREETERFKRMTPEQAKENLGALVKKMDVNGDNFVDKQELTKWIEQSFRQLNKEEALKVFDRQDEDSDGNVTFAEHFAESYGGTYDAKAVEEMKKEDPNLYAEMIEDEKKFNETDVDKNGMLNQTEFVIFMYAWNYPHMHGYLVANEMVKHDKNKDNTIDLTELLAAHKMDNATDEEKANEKKELDKYDDNKDGALQPAEYKNMLVSEHTHRAMVIDEVKHLFNDTDTNKDDKLSPEEIVAQFEIWVGSSVSNHKQAVAAGFRPWSIQEAEDEDEEYRPRYYERDEL